MAYPRLPIRWSNVNWTRNNKQLALKLQCSVATVWQYRRRYADNTRHPPGGAAHRGAKGQIDWAQADWKLRDEQIARMLNCSTSSVTKYRPLHGLPGQPRKRGSGRRQSVRLELWSPVVSNEVNARRMGCAVAYVPLAVRRYGLREKLGLPAVPAPVRRVAGKRVVKKKLTLEDLI